MQSITQAEWAPYHAFVQQQFQDRQSSTQIFASLQQAFPNFQPTLAQLQMQMRHWNLKYRRADALTYTNGRPKPPSELPKSEVKRILNVNDTEYRNIVEDFQLICAEMNIVRKGTTDTNVWTYAMEKMKYENAFVNTAWHACVTQDDHKTLDNALSLLMRKSLR